MTKEAEARSSNAHGEAHLIIGAFFSHYDLGLGILPGNRSLKPVASGARVW
jgi:hypothetical protein